MKRDRYKEKREIERGVGGGLNETGGDEVCCGGRTFVIDDEIKWMTRPDGRRAETMIEVSGLCFITFALKGTIKG